jgi:hypothetical protein
MVWSYYFGINYALTAILWEVGIHPYKLLLYGCVYAYEWQHYYIIENNSLCLYRQDGRLCTSYCSTI